MQVVVLRDGAELAEAAAALFRERVAARPDLAMAVPAGRTPRRMYGHLRDWQAPEPVDCGRMRVFSVDELCPPAPADGYFWRQVRRQFLAWAGVPPGRCHPCDAGASALEAMGCARDATHPRRLAETDPDRLDLRVVVEADRAHLAAEPGLLEAPEGQRGVEEVVGVHPHRARPDRARGLEGLGDVARPHRRREPVRRLVALRDALLDGLEGDHGEHGAEDLLTRDLHRVRDAVEDRGLDEVALPTAHVRAPAARHQTRALLLAGLDVAEHRLQLLPGDDRTHPGRLVHRIAHLDAFDLLGELGELERRQRRE